MSKKSKIQTKEFAKTFKQCVFQLKKMKEESKLVTKQDSINSYVNEDSEQLENVVIGAEIKNAWGQKDLNSILKEKNERVTFLENELEERKLAYSKLEQERKKARIEYEKEQKDANFEKILHEKDREVATLLVESDTNKRKLGELELQLQLEKGANDELKLANKLLNDIGAKKSANSYKRDYMSNLKTFIENEQEIQRLNALNATNERNLMAIAQSHKDCGVLIENFERVINDLESRLKFKSFSKEIEMNDIETVLMDEIDNITSAYDKISTTNLQLEKSLVAANSKITEISKENFSYKNRLGQFEENKAFLEKEKKRLEEWKTTLVEETRMFQERFIEMENSINEKDLKISEYKILITNLRTSAKLLEEESNLSNSNYRATKRELESLKAEFIHLKTDHESNKKLCELFKGFCSSDVEVVEDLERYKKVLRCSLCDTNIKNCVLVKCSHTFCDSCIDDRYKARHRKCPICQTEFNLADMKKIYL